MRLNGLLLASLLFLGLAHVISSDEVDVAEPISDNEEISDNGVSQDKDEKGAKTDQLTMESMADQELPPPKTLPYNQQPRLPTRGIPNAHIVMAPPHHGGKKPYHKKPILEHNSYNGPPPPPPPIKQQHAMDKYGTGEDIWPAAIPDMPKINSLDVKCEKNLMKVYIEFDKPFYGIVFSKGHYSNAHCVHLPAGLGRTSAHFDIGIHACGTSGNTENGYYGYGAESGSGTFFENIIVIQYDPQVQEVWDQARKLRCTWHNLYEKSVTFRPFPVDMLDVVRTDFAGDNVGCWMQIQVGKGPWASEVSGLVKIGQTMTMVLAIKDDDNKFDMLVRNCMVHDGKQAPIQLVDQKGCVTRPSLMSRFTKIKNFGASASVLSYAHFKAFKFPDSMEVHFQCTIQICRYQCPEQCSNSNDLGNGLLEVGHHIQEGAYGAPLQPHLHLGTYLQGERRRDERRIRRAVKPDPEKEVGVNRVIRVVSTGDLTFSIDDNSTAPAEATMVFPAKEEMGSSGLICMTTIGFVSSLVILLTILIGSCLTSAFLCLKLKPFSRNKDTNQTCTPVQAKNKKFHKTCFYS